MLANPAAERAILSGIYNHGYDEFIEIEDILDIDSFTIDSNQAIFRCIKHIYNEYGENSNIDFPSIQSAATSLGYNSLLNDKGEVDHLRAVLSLETKIGNARGFAVQIRKLQIAREAQTKLDMASLDIGKINGTEPLSDIISIPETVLLDFCNNIGQGSETDPTEVGDNILEYVQYLKDNPVETIGISSGYPILDKAIGGLRRKSVTLCGARAKTGKTFLGINIGKYTSSVGIRTLFLDTEMSKEQVQNRLIGISSGLSIDEIEKGQFTDNVNKVDKIDKAAQEIHTLPLDYISIAGRPFEEVLSIMRRWIIKKVGYENGTTKDAIIILDYLKLMDEKEVASMQEYQKLGFMMTHLHNFSVKYDIPIVAFVQLNRDGITKESTDAISGSDRQIWLCTNFLIYKRKGVEEIAEDGSNLGTHKLIPIETRHARGLDDGDYINMSFGDSGKIEERGSKKNPIGSQTTEPIEQIEIPF